MNSIWIIKFRTIVTSQHLDGKEDIKLPKLTHTPLGTRDVEGQQHDGKFYLYDGTGNLSVLWSGREKEDIWHGVSCLKWWSIVCSLTISLVNGQ